MDSCCFKLLRQVLCSNGNEHGNCGWVLPIGLEGGGEAGAEEADLDFQEALRLTAGDRLSR